jgi:ABC-type transport system involved in cytochrome bd biosynthesis fused ATPase/permease subunit
MEDASGEAPDAASASASVAPLKQLRVDLVRLRYAPVVRDARGGTSTRDVIHPLSTTFLPGTLTGLMGPSGSGKTSLLTVLAGFADEAHVGGDDARERRGRGARLARRGSSSGCVSRTTRCSRG